VDRSSPALGSVRRAWTSPDLDGAVYAQPLVLEDRVFVVTENDSIYALGAGTGRVIWRTHLGEPVPRSALPCGNIDPTGITGTPVIDPTSGLLYAVAFVMPGRHELVAVETASGEVRFRKPADAAGSDPLVHQQRGALAISGQRVYVPYGGLFGDCGNYRGTVVGVALDGSGGLAAYRVPAEREAGIWGPSGIAVEPSGDLLVATGNGSSGSQFDFGNSVIRLSPELRLVDWFAPSNWRDLNVGDTDLGSVGPAVLSNGLVFQVGKEGVGYLLRLSHLGRIGGQAFSNRVCEGSSFGGTAAQGPFVYVPCSGALVTLRVQAGPRFTVAWTGGGLQPGPPIVAGGAVWTLDVGSGRLFGFDAKTGHEVFRSDVGSVTRFASPTAAAGRLFVAAGGGVAAFSGV
jgi:outer membrane protein assembly factor BamB